MAKSKALVMPQAVVVGGSDYEVGWVKEGLTMDSKLLGVCDNAAQTIKLTYPVKSGQLGNTFIHEVLHAIYFERNLGGKSEEEQVTLLANGLCAFIRDNPDTVAFILSLLSQGNRNKLFSVETQDAN